MEKTVKSRCNVEDRLLMYNFLGGYTMLVVEDVVSTNDGFYYKFNFGDEYYPESFLDNTLTVLD